MTLSYSERSAALHLAKSETLAGKLFRLVEGDRKNSRTTREQNANAQLLQPHSDAVVKKQ